MSTPPTTPRQGMPKWAKWLLGCSAGCFGLVLLCCLGSCFGGRALFGDLVGKFRKAEEEKGLARAASERVAALDLDFPPRLPEDVAAAEVNDDDLQRYLRIRRALEAQASGYQAVVDGAVPQAQGAWAIARGVIGLVGAALDASAARRVVLEAAEPALRAESMGPTDLARLAEIVEWRFLRRAEAAFLGLPELERRRFLQMQLEERMLSAWTKEGLPPGLKIDHRTREESLRDLERVRERLRALEAEAATRTALTGGTLAALEARRGELEALSAAGLHVLAPLTAEPPLVGFVDDSGNVSINTPVRDGEGESAPPTGDETPPAPGDETAPAGESAAPGP